MNAEMRPGPDTSTEDREILVTRVLDAPRELVWKAFTDPKHVGHWWGPVGFTTTSLEMDVRPGGIWRHVMHGPDGVDYPNKTVYWEVVPFERLVYTNSGGKKGALVAEFRTTVTFEDLNGKTRLTMRAVFETAFARDHVVKVYGALEGAHQTVARLADYLPNMA